jgi:hypothetical protein
MIRRVDTALRRMAAGAVLMATQRKRGDPIRFGLSGCGRDVELTPIVAARIIRRGDVVPGDDGLPLDRGYVPQTWRLRR